MLLAVPIQTTLAVQTAARELALLLHESDAMQFVQVKTQDERMKWFKYARGASWDDKYSALLEKIRTMVCTWNKYAPIISLMSKANDITFAVEENAGLTLQKSQTGEKSPLPSLELVHIG